MARITIREALSQALWEEMEANEKIFLMGEEIGVWGGTYAVTRGFYDHFGPDRVRDTPIAEGVIAGAAIGAAMVGARPVAEIMTVNFALLAMDMIVNHAAKLRYMFGGQFKVPVIIRTPGGGGRQLGATHSQTLDALFAHFPGLRVVTPATAYDSKGMMKAALRQDDPVMFMENALLYQKRDEVPDGDYVVSLEKSDIKREGTDVTIVTYSRMLHESLAAAKKLAKEGISCEIVDLRCLRPLDLEPAFESFKKTNRAVIVEEGYPQFGVGAEISARIYEECFDYLDAPVKRVAQLDVPLPYNRALEQSAIPNVDTIIKAVKEVMYV